MKHARPGRKPVVVTAIIVAAIGAGAALTLSAQTSAQATATQVYSGKGWKIENNMYGNSDYIRSLSADGSGYTLAYADHKLQADVEQAAAQLTSVTGIAFTAEFRATMPAQNCSTWPRHLLELGTKWQPEGVVGMSQAFPCMNSGDHSAWGGWTWIDSEYWSPNFHISTDPVVNAAKIKNAISHEIGHLVGLDHPNRDLNGDGTVAAYECDLTTHGYRPLMCSPNGGYPDTNGGGQFTSLDTPGLKQLVANYRLPAPATAHVTAGTNTGTPHGVALKPVS